MADIKIVVATPAFGEMFYTPYVQSLLRLQRACHQRNWTMSHATVAYAYVVDARNYLLSHWYDETDASHLLFVDADMGFEPQLIMDMVAFDKPITGVIYPKRQIDLPRLAAQAAKGEPAERAIAQAQDYIIRPLRGRKPRRESGFLEVEGCGTGIMLIQRAAIDTLLAKLPNVVDANPKKTSALSGNLGRLIRAFDVIDAEGVPLTDDFAFCYRWQNLCKGELWARVDQPVTHIGLHRYGGRYVDAGNAGVSQRVQVTTGPLVKVGRDGKPTAGAPKAIAARSAAAAKTAAPAKSDRAAEKPAAQRLVQPGAADGKTARRGTPVSPDELILTFLRGQFDSPRWGRFYQAFLKQHGLGRAAMIDDADLGSAEQNRMRVRMVEAASGDLFRGFPSDVTWVRTSLAPAELGRLKYMNFAPWLTLSGKTRRVADGAANLDKVAVSDGPYSLNKHIRDVLRALRGGARFAELILVEGEGGDLILFEGHARATAYVAAGIDRPVDVIVGASPNMKDWAFY